MSTFKKKVVQRVKSKFIPTFLIDLISFVIFFFFLEYTRNKVQDYLTQLQNLAPYLLEMQTALQQSADIQTLNRFNEILTAMDAITQRALVFGMVVLPLVLFMLLVLSQGTIYKIIKGGKLNDGKYFARFALVSLVFYIPMIFIFRYLAVLIANPFNYQPIDNPKFLLLLGIVTFIIVYFLFIAYSLFNIKGIRSLKTMFNLGIRKFYILIQMTIPYLLFLGIVFFSIMNSFIFRIVNEQIPIYLFVMAFFSLFIFEIYRLFHLTYLETKYL